MSAFFERHKYLLILYLILLVSVVLSNARGDFPLNDDWTYAWSVQKWLKDGVVILGDWPAMTLVTHLFWGLLFTKTFGFSFVVLRFSTLISVLIGLTFLFHLTEKMSGKKQIAFLACLSLLSTPLYFSLANTFMTDVNFCTLLIIAIYVAWQFFERPSVLLLSLALVLSIALVLLRQFGIIYPLMFFFTNLFLGKKNWHYSLGALLLIVITYWIYSRYEAYLKLTLSPAAAYKYSDAISPVGKQFWMNLYTGMAARYRIFIIHALFYTTTFTIAFLPAVIKGGKNSWTLLISLGSVALVALIFTDYPLQVGNVMSNVAIGPDTTFTTLNGYYGGPPHLYSQAFAELLDFLKIVFLSLSFGIIINACLSLFKTRQLKFQANFFFLICLFAAYLVMLLEADTFFDRYQLPVILFSLLILTFLFRDHQISFVLVLVPLVFWMYVSIGGTRDYFSWNRLKWQAYEELKNKEHVDASVIHGGFEIMCWEGGSQRFYKEFDKSAPFQYILQFDELDSFTVYKSYPFRRYLLPGADTLKVLKRVKFAKNSVPEQAEKDRQ